MGGLGAGVLEEGLAAGLPRCGIIDEIVDPGIEEEGGEIGLSAGLCAAGGDGGKDFSGIFEMFGRSARS